MLSPPHCGRSSSHVRRQLCLVCGPHVATPSVPGARPRPPLPLTTVLHPQAGLPRASDLQSPAKISTFSAFISKPLGRPGPEPGISARPHPETRAGLGFSPADAGRAELGLQVPDKESQETDVASVWFCPREEGFGGSKARQAGSPRLPAPTSGLSPPSCSALSLVTDWNAIGPALQQPRGICLGEACQVSSPSLSHLSLWHRSEEHRSGPDRLRESESSQHALCQAPLPSLPTSTPFSNSCRWENPGEEVWWRPRPPAAEG